jgi:hypothetical protein
MRHARILLCALVSGLALIAWFLVVKHAPVRGPVSAKSPLSRASITVRPAARSDASPASSALPAPSAPPANEPAAAPARPRVPVPASAKLVSELANRGNATAIAGAETYMWASVNRQTDVAASLIKWHGGPDEGTWTYGGNDRFRDVPEPWQSQIKTPERLIAIMQENELESFGAYEIKRREVIGPKYESIEVRWFAPDGSFVDQTYVMRLTPIGWRREIHSVFLDRLVKKLQGAR